MAAHMASDLERVVLLAVVGEISHAVYHVFEDRGPREDEESVLRRDEREDVETGDNSGNLADKGKDFEEVHAQERVSTARLASSTGNALIQASHESAASAASRFIILPFIAGEQHGTMAHPCGTSPFTHQRSGTREIRLINEFPTAATASLGTSIRQGLRRPRLETTFRRQSTGSPFSRTGQTSRKAR